MSSSLAYGLGAGGTDRWDKEVNVDAIKKGVAPLLKKHTYTDPLKRLSWPKRGSRSRGNSLDTPVDQANTSPTNAPEILQSNEIPDPATATAAIPGHTETTPQTSVSHHSLDSTSPESQLSAILSLSNTIFREDADSTKYSALSTWQSHLSKTNSVIFFATIPSPGSEADLELIGFIFAFPRIPTDYSATVADQLIKQNTQKVLHIWMGGVLSQYQEKGVFGELMQLVEEHAREKGMGDLSVATLPEKFGRMFDLLKRRGWVEIDDGHSSGSDVGKAVLMKKVATEADIGVAK